MGDGVDLLFSPSVLSKVIAGNKINILRVFNPGQLDDGHFLMLIHRLLHGQHGESLLLIEITLVFQIMDFSRNR